MKTYSLLLGLFVSFGVLAHPHAFIDIQTTPIIENNQLTGFSMKWTLDEPSSSAVIYDMKQARTKSEKQKLLDDVMGNIVSEHYFSYLYDAQNNKSNIPLAQKITALMFKAYNCNIILMCHSPIRKS